jgi:hypothetical protein
MDLSDIPAQPLIPKPNSASGYKGVHKNKERWEVRIKGHALGTFDTPEEAAGIYARAVVFMDRERENQAMSNSGAQPIAVPIAPKTRRTRRSAPAMLFAAPVAQEKNQSIEQPVPASDNLVGLHLPAMAPTPSLQLPAASFVRENQGRFELPIEAMSVAHVPRFEPMMELSFPLDFDNQDRFGAFEYSSEFEEEIFEI